MLASYLILETDEERAGGMWGELIARSMALRYSIMLPGWRWTARRRSRDSIFVVPSQIVFTFTHGKKLHLLDMVYILSFKELSYT